MGDRNCRGPWQVVGHPDHLACEESLTHPTRAGQTHPGCRQTCMRLGGHAPAPAGTDRACVGGWAPIRPPCRLLGCPRARHPGPCGPPRGGRGVEGPVGPRLPMGEATAGAGPGRGSTVRAIPRGQAHCVACRGRGGRVPFATCHLPGQSCGLDAPECGASTTLDRGYTADRQRRMSALRPRAGLPQGPAPSHHYHPVREGRSARRGALSLLRPARCPKPLGKRPRSWGGRAVGMPTTPAATHGFRHVAELQGCQRLPAAGPSADSGRVGLRLAKHPPAAVGHLSGRLRWSGRSAARMGVPCPFWPMALDATPAGPPVAPAECHRGRSPANVAAPARPLPDKPGHHRCCLQPPLLSSPPTHWPPGTLLPGPSHSACRGGRSGRACSGAVCTRASNCTQHAGLVAVVPRHTVVPWHIASCPPHSARRGADRAGHPQGLRAPASPTEHGMPACHCTGDVLRQGPWPQRPTHLFAGWPSSGWPSLAGP